MWNWPLAAPEPLLAPGEVHVWAAALALPANELSGLAALLDPAERERAARFVQPLHRDRFIAAHGLLRQVLARCLRLQPAQVQFTPGANGKPSLAGAGPLQFNLAHSGDVTLIAVANGRAVGVDVEQARDMIDAEAIAARFFSAQEQAALAALPASEKQAGFFRLWTRKEAWIKATGAGLSFPLAQLTMSLAEPNDDCLLSVDGAPAAAAQWRVRALPAPAGYAAAVAAEGRDWRLHLWRT